MVETLHSRLLAATAGGQSAASSASPLEQARPRRWLFVVLSRFELTGTLRMSVKPPIGSGPRLGAGAEWRP